MGLGDAAIERLRVAIRADGPEHPRYRFGEVVGSGGMGTVYRCHDLVLERDVAIKVLRGPDSDPALAVRLGREARLLARLDHPGLVPVHDMGTLADGRAFYVMRLVRGERLDTWLERTTSLAERLRLFLRILDPVAFAHAHGVVHRDLKPANIMVGPFGEVLVLDWGIAKTLGEPDPGPGPSPADPGPALEAEPTGPGMVLGTRGFMAPEQARGDSAGVDARSDVYALGAVLGVVIAGADRPPPRLLEAIRAKAMAGRPAGRYSALTEFKGDLSRFLDGLPVSAYRESPAERLVRLAARHRTALALVVAYVLVRLILLLAGRR